ncbi:MAG: bifunctional 5,10-methylene-tetrahydrofolate dehydrogenase/5,10-methylene-tetrahydrofolate cyclohydrolase, partial [Sphingobacteriales bacterium]
LLDGKNLSNIIKQELNAKVEARKKEGKKIPHLSAILVGEDPASETYIRNKILSCEQAGFESSLFQYKSYITEQELLQKIAEINADDTIDGLIVQLPLPKHIDVVKVIESIDYTKDVDGFHPINIGRMAKGLRGFLPATPYGIIKLIEHYNIETKGKHCVVVGRSQIVGSPVSILMSRDGYPGNATVTLCHRHTEDLKSHTLTADIIISAVGQPGLITKDMVKDGAVIIDVGTTRVEDASKKSGFRLSGDVDFEQVKDKTSYITPVPGGVGPMTIACLLLNTMQAAEQKWK